MYLLLTQNEYADTWARQDCATREDLEKGILEALRKGLQPVVAELLEYEIEVRLGPSDRPAAPPPAPELKAVVALPPAERPDETD